jgi:hypothetical protein
VSSYTDTVKCKGKAPMVASGSGSSPSRSPVTSGNSVRHGSALPAITPAGGLGWLHGGHSLRPTSSMS